MHVQYFDLIFLKCGLSGLLTEPMDSLVVLRNKGELLYKTCLLCGANLVSFLRLFRETNGVWFTFYTNLYENR